MKIIKNVFCFLAAALAASCAGNVDPNDVLPGTPVEPYTLTVDKSQIESDGKDAATLVVTDANGLVLTEGNYLRQVSFHITETGEWRSGMGYEGEVDKFSSIIDGSYTISAMYAGKECANTVSVASRNRKKYELFHKNVAIYRLTGTWCQYCPYMTEALSNVDAFTKDHSIVMEFHNGDEFSVAYNSAMDLAAFLLSRYGTKDDGYPYCIYSISEGSGKRTVNDIKRFVMNRLVEHPAQTGIKASSTLVDGKLTVNASVMASVAGKYDLGMAVLKDRCVPTPNPQNPPHEDIYNDVVISASGNFYAMSTDSFTLEADAEKTMVREWESPKLDADDCRVVLFTLREADGKVIIDNAVDFKAGETIDYRYNQ